MLRRIRETLTAPRLDRLQVEISSRCNAAHSYRPDAIFADGWHHPLLKSGQILCHLLFLLSTFTVLFAIQTPIFPWIFLLGAAGMFLGMLLLTALCRDRNSILAAIFLALLVRLLFLLLYPASADIDRYIWEGAIQHHGLNPFLIAPNDQATLPFRDELWERASFRDSTTIYWPLAQLLFLLTTSISEQPLARK